MAKGKDLEKRRLITPKFRVSYPSVFEKVAYEDGTPEYSVTALFTKKTDLTPLKKAAIAAAKEKWGPDKDAWPKRIRWPWRDGDKEKPDSPEYEDTIFVKFSNKRNKPGLVTAGNRIITDEEEFYAGCYARAEIVAYAYEKAGNRGISFDLWTIQKLGDGEAFSGRRNPTEVFEAIEDEENEGELEEDEEDEKPAPKKGASSSKKKPKKPEPEEDEDELDDEDDEEDEKPKKGKKAPPPPPKSSKKKKPARDEDEDDDDIDFGFD